MMESVHLVTSDDDDLYGGYNEFHPALDTRTLQSDEGFQQAVLKSSYGKRNASTARGPSRIGTAGFNRMGTAGVNRAQLASQSRRRNSNSQMPIQPPSTARPMTAVRGAGYTSLGGRGAPNMFDPMNQAKNVASPLQLKDESSPEAKLKQLEQKVNDLVEDSTLAAYRNEFGLALEKAKEAVSKEKALARQRETSGLAETIPVNTDLSFSVLFNLAVQYTNNEMYNEAISTYQNIVKNRTFTNTGRLKVNIGHIYYKQGNYPKAIKFFRMALDQIPNVQKDMRLKIMHNIGLAFVKINQWTDAITSFEYIMSEKGDFRTALHLIVCHYALGDREKMKRCLAKLLEINSNDFNDEKYAFQNELLDDDPLNTLLMEAIKNDQLRKIERERKHEAEWCILIAAKLIAPVMGETFSHGYEWCVDQIRNSQYSDLANDLEINKAVKHLRKREFNEAIGTLKAFEKKESKAASTAATNLSFMYLLQNEVQQAEKYADEAIATDHYNAGALVNKGNCCYKQNDYERAKEYYKEALSNDSSCVEAIYNLALANKKIGQHDSALDFLLKLQAIAKNHPHVLYQIAQIYEHLGDKDQSMDFYQLLLTFVPSDPNLLNKLSDIADSERDKQQAFSYLTDSFRYFPSHIPTIERLAAYYIENQIYEKAIRYLDRAAQVQPSQIKWLLMIAACHRRNGNYQQALHSYKSIHQKFPDNIECLRFLVRLCTDMGLAESVDYSEKLKRAEKAKEVKDRGMSAMANSRSQSRSARRSASSREGSASSSSSGYLTSTSPRNNSSKKKKNLEVDINKNVVDLPGFEDAVVPNERPTTSWKRNNKDIDDDFANDEISDILPE